MRQPNPLMTTAKGSEYDQSVYCPGSIQPHGMLIAFRESDLEIVQVSSNCQEFLGIQPSDLLGQPLTRLWEPEQIERLQAALAENLGRVNALTLTLESKPDLDGTVHRTEELVILELERSPAPNPTLPHLYQQARMAIAKFQQTDSLSKLLQLAADEIRTLTGFDRVMLYQFDPQGAGTVLAEAKESHLQAYLGLHFPALDVPDVARELFRRCLVRYSPNLNASPVPLVSGEDATALPLDLGLAELRSVDPCAVQYYQNMGAAAFFVMALIKDRQLWGLLSCHHGTPKVLPAELRQVCELLGQFISLELSQKVDQDELDHMARFKALHSALIESISQSSNLRDALVNPAPRLLELVDAQGAAVCLGNEITLVGETPSLTDVQALLEWTDTQSSENLFFTDALPTLYPPALNYKAVASGLLLLRISKVRRYAILWFRPEVLQTVHWGGNPNHGAQQNADIPHLSPPASFERWQETVRFTSLPWKSYELTNALDLRNAIVGIVLKTADELAQVNQELERRNRELDSFAFAASHDLREPLRGVYNYATILQEDYEQVLDEEGMDYLQTIVKLAQRMDKLVEVLLRFSQVGQAALNLQQTDLNALLHQAIEVLQAGQPDRLFEVRMPRPLPTIRCDPLLVNEVFTNLLSNAFKYNHQATPWAEVGYLDPTTEPPTPADLTSTENRAVPVFYIQDNGIGIRPQHLNIIFRLFKRLHAQEEYGGGSGAGLTIVQKAIERHGGKIWVESTYGEGSTFYFTLG